MRSCFFSGKVGDYKVLFVATRKCRSTAEAGKLNEEVILSIMTEEKPNQVEQFKIPKKRIDKYFSPGTTPKQIEDTIIKALELYRKRERGRER